MAVAADETSILTSLARKWEAHGEVWEYLIDNWNNASLG